MLQQEKGMLNPFGKNKTEQREYEKPTVIFFAFQQGDVIRTSAVNESGGDTYLSDLTWIRN